MGASDAGLVETTGNAYVLKAVIYRLKPRHPTQRLCRRCRWKAEGIRPAACQLDGFLSDLRRLRQLEGRSRQQLPAAVLLLPDLQDADLSIGNFAVEFAFRHPQMTHYGVVANDRDCELWKIKRLEDSLSRHDRVDEFGLVFEADGTAIRPDILAHLKDERALTLLCSKWGSAPDPSAQNLLTHVGQTDADRSLLGRVVVVAMARSGDALSMRHDSGESAEDVAVGYEIKLGQVERALQKIGIRALAAFASDASADDPAEFTNFIIDRIGAIRRGQSDAARATIAAVDQMLANREEAQALAAMETVGATVERFARRNAELRRVRRPAYDRLLDAVVTLHPRTVWAATTRAGRFWNFDVFE